MRKQWMVLVAAMTALGITACGSGDGIVINGTSAVEADNSDIESGDAPEQETTSGTKIEIVTGETTTAAESAAESTEGYEEAPVIQTQAETAAQTTAAAPAAAQPETTAAKVYKVTDMKKTMYATASVRVRASYSTSSDVLAGLSKDEKVEVTGQSENGWLRVNYKGNVGYVSKDYLTEKEPQTTTSLNSSTTTTTTTNSSTVTGGTTSGTGTTSSSSGPTGPVANNTGTTSGQTTGPGGSSTGNTSSTGSGAVSPGSSTSPSGTTSPGSTVSPSGSGTSSGNSVTGSVTALDPSGVTVQTSTGTTYQFVWGDNVPALAPGEKIQIFYETTSSGEKKVTSYSK